MPWQKDYTVWCDGDDGVFECVRRVSGDSEEEVSRLLMIKGWFFAPDDKHYCPTCRKEIEKVK